MKKLLPRVLLGVAAGVAIYVAFSIWAGAKDVGAALASFSWWAALAALGLATANYLLRFVRWHYYLHVLGVKVPVGESLLVFLGGFALTITPGKLGEAVKAYVVLKEPYRGRVEARDIVEFCRARLTAYKVPRRVEFRDELPLSRGGQGAPARAAGRQRGRMNAEGGAT